MSQLTELRTFSCPGKEGPELLLNLEFSDECKNSLSSHIDTSGADNALSGTICVVPSPAQVLAGPVAKRDQRIADWKQWLTTHATADNTTILLLNDALRHPREFCALLGHEYLAAEDTGARLDVLISEAILLEAIGAHDITCITELAACYDDIKLAAKFLKGTLTDFNDADRIWQTRAAPEVVTSLRAANSGLADTLISLTAKDVESETLDQLTPEITSLTNALADHKQQIVGLEQQRNQLSQELIAANNALGRSDAATAELKSEVEISKLQISQLQEELTALFAAKKDSDELAAELERSQASLNDASRTLEQLKTEAEISELQIAQLQEELEALFLEHAKNSAAANENEQLKKTAAEFEAHCQQLQTEIDAAIATRDAALQTLNEKADVEDVNLTLKQQLEKQSVELEICELQIAQLQEELESLFVDQQQVTRRNTELETLMVAAHTHNMAVLPAGSINLTEWFESGSYREIKAEWHQVNLGAAPFNLSAKIVLRDFEPQLELRPAGAPALDLDWESAEKDDWGPYLLFSTSDIARRRELLAFVDAVYLHSLLDPALTQSARLLISDLYFALHPTRLPELQRPGSMPHPREAFATDGYAHLAFDLDIKTHQKPAAMRIKLCAVGGTLSTDTPFDGRLDVELRTLNDSPSALPSWPYGSADDYGPLLRFQLSFVGPVTFARCAEEVDSAAKTLVEQVVTYLAAWLEAKADGDSAEGPVDTDTLEAWRNSVSPLFASQKTCFAHGAEPARGMTLVRFEEFAQPGYAHFAYVLTSDSNAYIVKLQAIDHFKGQTAGDPALQFRPVNGGSIPLSTTPFASQDDYGLQSCIRLSEMKKIGALNTSSEQPDESSAIQGGQNDVGAYTPDKWEEADRDLIVKTLKRLSGDVKLGASKSNPELPEARFWVVGVSELLNALNKKDIG